MISWFAGLGLAAKIALGAGVALAATAGATAGAGAAGILPPAAQSAFNTVVTHAVTPGDDSTESTPTSDPTETPEPTETAHPDNFGGVVSTGAQDPDKVGRDFGSQVSDAAHYNGQGTHTPAPSSDDGQGSTNSSDNGNQGNQGKSTDAHGSKP